MMTTQNLKLARQQLGWTQERMAQECCMSLRTYCRAEHGRPSRPVAKLINYIVTEHTRTPSATTPEALTQN